MPPEWDADSPELRDNIVRVLESIERHAVKREPPTLDDARRWQSGLMRGLEVGNPKYVGAYRGEAGLENVQVHVDWVFGVAAPEVGVALVDFERRLQLVVAHSTAVIHECAQRGIPIAVCRLSGRPVARILPARSPLSALLVHRQLAARSGRSGTGLVQAILSAKLANQRALLLYHSKYRGRDAATKKQLVDAAQAIAGLSQQIDAVANRPLWRAREYLFLTEARAAAHYWQAFAGLVPSRLGFPRRLHRGAEDVVNKMLN